MNDIKILDMSDPDFGRKLVEAMGLKDGDAVQIATPQFTRTDKITPVNPSIEVFEALPHLPDESLVALGLLRWDEAEAGRRSLWLFPAEWYCAIPKGMIVETIMSRIEPFDPDTHGDDRRFGVLSYGVRPNNL